jgi:hypothetical protein
VHVVAGDITHLHRDAWLLPTDSVMRISPSFARAAGCEPGACLEGLDWNGERVIPFRRLEGAPQIWLANVGTADAERPEWYTSVIEPFVRAAIAHLPARDDGRPPLLAVNVLGTGHGGMAAGKGAINEALLPELYRVGGTYDVDLVLVCWDRRAYSAAQRARRRLVEAGSLALSTQWDLGDRQADLEGIADALAVEARTRELVLFVGAGVSAGAGLPAWQGLLDGVAATLRDPVPQKDLHRLDFRDQAALLERRLQQDHRSLRDVLKQQVGRDRYALTHGLLASLNARETVTTNYDRLMETATAAVDHSPPAVLPYEAVASTQRWVLKLHGGIDDDSGAPSRHGALFGLVQAMLLTRHMLFVGYSLEAEDFHQVVHDVRQARSPHGVEPRGTVLTLFRDDLFANSGPMTSTSSPSRRGWKRTTRLRRSVTMGSRRGVWRSSSTWSDSWPPTSTPSCSTTSTMPC